MAIVVERPWNASPTTTSIVALVILAVLCTALGNVLYFRLLGTLGSLGTTAQSYLRVPIGVLAGMLLVGETLTSTAGIGLVLRRRRRDGDDLAAGSPAAVAEGAHRQARALSFAGAIRATCPRSHSNTCCCSSSRRFGRAPTSG